MPTGKMSLRSDLKVALERQKSELAQAQLVDEYLDLWTGDRKPESLEESERLSLSMFRARSKNLLDGKASQSTDRMQDLFGQLGLSPTSNEDRMALLQALADVVLPDDPGAKKKWDAAKYDDLWNDMAAVRVKHPEVEDQNGKFLAESTARQLVKMFAERYVGKSRHSTKEKTIQSLRRRVADAQKFEPLVNPNLAVIPFEYFVRGDLGAWPSCAAGLPDQPSLRRGSSEWQEAKTYEDKMVARSLNALAALGVVLTKRNRLFCRQAARQIARAHYWDALNKGSQISSRT